MSNAAKTAKDENLINESITKKGNYFMAYKGKKQVDDTVYFSPFRAAEAVIKMLNLDNWLPAAKMGYSIQAVQLI